VHHDSSVPISDSDDKMSIAWRYQNMQVAHSSPTSTSFGHHYDLTKPIDTEVLKGTDVCYWTGFTGCRRTEGKRSCDCDCHTMS